MGSGKVFRLKLYKLHELEYSVATPPLGVFDQVSLIIIMKPASAITYMKVG